MAKKTRPIKSRQSGMPQKQTTGEPNWFVRNPTLTALGIFFLLALVFFFNVIFGGKTYLSPDAQSAAAMSAPLDKAFWETWKLPLWSPYIFCGMPSFASLMYAPFVYLPGTILLPLSRLLSPPDMLFPALHFVFAAMGIFLLLRRKGASFWPALFGGAAFMFTPYLIAMQAFGHGSQMMTSAYIPWALWAVDCLIEKFSWRHLALAGLILGFQLQRGHVQIAYYSLMMVGLYVLFHFIYFIVQKYYNRLLPTLSGVAGALILAGALSAVLFLLLQEYTPFSIRGSPSLLQAAPSGTPDTGVGFEYATQWSFSPGEMMTFIIPSFYGFGGQPFYWGNMPFTDYPNYMGILVLAFAIVAFVLYLPKPGPNRLLVMFLGTTILLALLLSYGYHFAFFYKLFYNYLPYFNKFRVPVMILILVQCTVAILAGLGLEGMVARLRAAGTSTKDEIAARSQISRRLWIALAALAAIILLLTIFRSSFFDFMRSVYPDQYEPDYQKALDEARFDMLFKDAWIVFFIAAGGITMLVLAAAQKISATTAAALIGLMTLTDLWLVDKKIGKTYPQTEISNFLQPDAITQFLQADSPSLPEVTPAAAAGSVHRIYPAGQLFGELRWSGQGFQSVGGYHAAKPRLYQDFNEAMGLQGATLPARHIVDLLNAKYIITFETLSDTNFAVRQQFQTGSGVLRIYENRTVLPRAYLVGEYVVETEPVAALTRIRTGPEANGKGFDPQRQVLLNEEPELKPQTDAAATAQITQYDFHQVTISTQSASPQILVLSDNYYPVGWQAYVDNQPVKTYRANYCFRAISLPAGAHQVEFRFHSQAFTRGLWASIAALIVAIALLFVERKRLPATS